jgi:HPt (histidine-containing phosphotransfer) domain-containing protein
MDCLMPGMDGYEATRKIRGMYDNSQRRIPIVALTADVGTESRKACSAAGMNEFIGKPIDSMELRAVLKRHLQYRTEPNLTSEESHPGDTKDVSSATGIALHHSARGLLDVDIINEIAALQRPGQQDLLTKVVGIYLDESAKLIKEIRQGVAQRDYSKIRSASHSLKSSSAHVGAHTIAAFARDLETLSKDKSLDGAENLVQSIQNDLSRLEPELKSLVLKRTA